MVDSLKQMGYRVTLWVHLFINRNCPLFDEYLSKGYFVKDQQGNVKTGWWNSNDSAAIDMTNSEARTSFFSRLAALKEQTGLDGYKFDSGESAYLPQLPDMNVRLMQCIFHLNFISRWPFPGCPSSFVHHRIHKSDSGQFFRSGKRCRSTLRSR
jgi:alpha-glucosidase (family GH31 glycosyl hydrolase)